MNDDLREKLLSVEQWKRIAYMAGFLLLGSVLSGVIVILYLVVIALQILSSLVYGQPNDNLLKMSAFLNRFVSELLSFLTYNSEIKPFPVSPENPESAGDQSEGQQSNYATASQAPVDDVFADMSFTDSGSEPGKNNEAESATAESPDKPEAGASTEAISDTDADAETDATTKAESDNSRSGSTEDPSKT